MNTVNWRAVDLNLLVTFVTLMETCSVTKAADKLALGQSAMSHSLGRLRKLLDDPLFVRQGHRMVPTSRALELQPTVQALLDTVATQILTPAEFIPENYQGAVRIGLTDYAELIFAPSLFDEFGRQAPECRLSFRPVDRVNYLQALKDDHVDVVVGAMSPPAGDFDTEFLYTEQHVCLFDPASTNLRPPINLSDYLLTPHALVSVDGKLESQVDETLSALGYQRRVAMGSQRFLTVRHLLSGRNLLCTVAELMARQEMFNDSLAISPAPIDVSSFDIRSVWQKQNSTNAKNSWIRDIIAKVVISRAAYLRG